MARQPRSVIGFWKSLRRGPWGENVTQRIETALLGLATQLGSLDGSVALIVYGSYARGEAGRQSDLDLLILFAETSLLQHHEKEVLTLISQIESQGRLPVHISPLLGALDELDKLGDGLVHAVASEGVILFGQMSDLYCFVPQQPTPATVITFSLHNATPAVRMRLNRRLHGYAAWRTRDGQRTQVSYTGLITPPSRSLGRGVLLVPGGRRAPVIEALEEAGATYTEANVWLTS